MTNTEIIKIAQSWIGKNERDGSHREIINVYNSQRPLPRGYAVKYTDAWCATFVSAVAVKCNCTNIIPPECSCPRMIGLFQKMGCWDENDSRVPNPGDIIFYDWDDSGAGDNKGSSEHVGIVEAVNNGIITVIEGNYHDAVGRRNIKVNGRYIRGYGVPKYDSIIPTPIPTPAPSGYTKEQFIREVQMATGAGVDGIYGPDTLNHTITVTPNYMRHPVVAPLQKRLYALGYTEVGSADGCTGPKFKQAVEHFQKEHGRNVDGIITARNITWQKLLTI